MPTVSINALFRYLPRLALLAASAYLGGIPTTHSQEPPPPTTKEPAVRITFLPPPLEGTLSVGVYDRNGKLVRTLHHDASVKDLSSSLNGLITFWDGKDDNGIQVPAARYRVRGLAVGELELTGEAFHANDWVFSEESPRPSSFQSLAVEANELSIVGRDSTGQEWKFIHPLGDGQARTEALPDSKPNKSLNAEPGPSSCAGRDGTRWSIEKVLGEPLVVQMDAQGEVARRLSIGAGEPVPVAIAASQEREEVFLLERDGDRWRLRGLRRKNSANQPASGPGWETFIEKNRWPSNRFSDVTSRVGRSKPFRAEPTVSIKAEANPFSQDASRQVELAIGTDVEGSFLKTADGLPVRRLTDTLFLKWAVLGHEEQQPELVLLQGDGAVVEEYRIRQPGKLMLFDAGEYQWPPR